jgi:hypothetical protein
MKILFAFVFILFPIHASLFLTNEEKKETRPALIGKKNSSSFKLKAIFYRPDLKYWIVWINNVRIDSRHPMSIEGWTITHVSMDNVRLRSIHGQDITLFLPLQFELEQTDPQATQ